jgi:hypothetical protein
MKKKLILLCSVAVLAIGGVVYGLNQHSAEECPLTGTPDCPMEKSCTVNNTTMAAVSTGSASEKKPVTIENDKTACPMVGDCCKKH